MSQPQGSALLTIPADSLAKAMTFLDWQQLMRTRTVSQLLDTAVRRSYAQRVLESLREAQLWSAGTGVLMASEGRFLFVDPNGKVTRYHPSQSSVEGELYTTDFYVHEDQFCECLTIRSHGESEDKREVHSGLGPAGDAEYWAVAEALGKDALAVDEAKQREEDAAEARVAAIEGASEGYALGANFECAQRGLVHRVRRYGDAEAEQLLRTLVALATADASRAVVEAYAIGCRHACFESAASVPPLDGVPGHDGPKDPGLAERIAARASALLQSSEVQESADAMQNARCLRRAADALSKAAGFLA
jgi:hypothetical protein